MDPVRFLDDVDFETVLLAPQALIVGDACTLNVDRRIPFDPWRVSCRNLAAGESTPPDASPGAQQPDRLVTLEEIEQHTQRQAAFARKFGIAPKDQFGVVAGNGEKTGVGDEIGDTKAGQAGLAQAEQLALAAQPQIFFSNTESVFRLT